MMKPKLIKNNDEYQEALTFIESLMDAQPGSPEEEELELFSFLVHEYEVDAYPIGLPDPIEAIKFRMDQQGLTRKDLEQYIGSQSKVSEVINKKRPLSLAMIRSLNRGLSIPAEILLQDQGMNLPEVRYKVDDYPFTEMYKRNYFGCLYENLNEAKQYSEELLDELFSVFRGYEYNRVFCRNSAKKMNEFSLIAWQARVIELVEQKEFPVYSKETLTLGFIREIIKTSYFSTGPNLANELLFKQGIPLVLLPHLPQTYLDGACFITSSNRPVIGLTLRHDRLDNFWFTLVHELAHIYLHLRNDSIAFFDDTELSNCEISDPFEIKADEFARDLLIPRGLWEKEKERILNTKKEEDIISFADHIKVSPAIIAGRIRWESNNYSLFSNLIGKGIPRKVLSYSG
jgi:HTH-type transcriptional regulator/antitoxin HigA